MADTKTPFGASHIIDYLGDKVHHPAGRGELHWGFRFNKVDLASSHDYVWPYPGNWAQAPGPILDHDGDCCRERGDGICAALTVTGAQSAGNHFAHHVGLLVAWRNADVLGQSEHKVRLRRAWVAALFDPVAVALASRATANLYSANLCSANLYSANLRSANLRSADLYSANLYSADLYSADLYSANLYSANLRSANLYSADLRSANLCSADLYSANLYSANLYSANLYSANLYSADLCSANLCSANLYSADLRSANLCSADLRSANLYSADLRSANLCSARYDQLTLWPEGYNAEAHGAIKDPS